MMGAKTMTPDLRRIAALSVIAVTITVSSPSSRAGGTMGDDDHDDSRNVVGFVRDLGAGPLPDARVTAVMKGTTSSFVTRADGAGHYRIAGLPADMDAKAVDVTCVKDGLKFVRAVLRNPSAPPEAPVEVDCLMEK
jgi:hypothetical protein